MTTPGTRVVRLHELGGPDALKIDTMAPRDPDTGEVLINVAFIGLNNSEAQLRRGDYPMMDADMPTRIGRECTGIVEAVGPCVDRISPGDRVCTIPAFDVKRHGVYGDWCVVPQEAVVPLPENLGMREGAAVWQQYLTAFGPLVLYGNVGKEDRVLVTAGASSVGLGAIQMAKARGAEVMATSRTAAKAEAMRTAGADHVVITSQAPLADEVMRLTNGRGFTLCLDPIAGPGVADLLACAAPKAKVFLYGQLDSQPAPLPLIDLLKKGASIQGYTLWEITLDPDSRRRAVNEISGMITSGKLAPIIDSEFTLDDIVEAHRYLDSGRQAGKIVVRVMGDPS